MAIQPVFTHSWDVSPAKAREIQHQLCGQVVVEPLGHQPDVIAGIDVSVKNNQARAAVVLLSFPDLVPLQATTAEMSVPFPYVPGLLAFREGPVVLEALNQLEGHPDVLMFDAQGLAHPRRMGLATHLGILLDMPTVGCAKSKLCGTYTKPEEKKGSWTPLTDKGEVTGAVVRTRDNVRPVFVSVGHRIDLKAAVALVLDCATKYRLPQTTRWAHKVAGGEPLPATRQSTLLNL
jgi:deoxyribonuclease V